MKQEKPFAKADTNYNLEYPKSFGLKEQAPPFFNIAQHLESLAVRSSWVSSLYSYLFYEDLLEKELALADLEKAASVLHIGCGACPYTALYLAQKGCRVDACDCCMDAVYKAQTVVAKQGYSSKITIFPRNGTSIDCSIYDAVWISLNTYPKKKVILQALKTMKPGGKLIYRNNPPWLEKALFRASQVDLEEKYPFKIKKAFSRLGAESVIVLNNRFRSGRCDA